MFPIGGPSFQASAGLNININLGGGAGGAMPQGGGGGCSCGGGVGDGYFPSSELGAGGGPGFGLSPFGPPGLNNFASQLAGNPLPDFSQYLGDAHPWANGIGGPDASLPASLLLEGADGGGLPPLGGGGSLTDQALMLQAASSDANQASLIGAQTGSMGSLMGAQGTALAGINPLMSGLMSNYG
jgi:hypothetical protein